jgi:predicted dehydrogenase
MTSTSVSTGKRLRWGVLGAAKIATQKVIPAIQQAGNCEVVAIASRDPGKATAAGRTLGIPRAYGGYQELLDDPDVDAVYIPLTNDLHVPWTTRAAESGKHVLCEKPIALNADDARTLLKVRDRSGVYIQEAFMVRSHPQWRRAKAMVDGGELGDVRAMAGFFSYLNTDARNVRNVKELGGGGLLDIGCYLVNTARLIFGGEPIRVAGALELDPTFGVDRLTSMILDFGGRHAIGTCSTQLQAYQRIQIVGTKARLEIEIPFNAPPDRACRLLVDRTGDLWGGGVETIELPVVDQFTLQAQEFAGAILEKRPQAAPLEDAVANMVCIDAVARSTRSGRWEKIR